MPYRSGNYSFVIDSSFRPYTFDEMLKPLAIYSQEYKATEDAINELETKASIWDGMADEQRDPIAYGQYKKYADDARQQAEYLSQNGLTPTSRRDLLNLKRRYASEIKPIEDAYNALKEEQHLRRNNKDLSMIYADDNLNIDKFLKGSTPNLYNVSGNELYARGAEAGKKSSSRIYDAGDAGSTLGGYYRDYVQKMGYTPEQLNRFGEQIMEDFTARVSDLPELQIAANQILESYGANQNLEGNNLRRAQQQVIRGIIDGAVYSEDHKPVRDEGVMSASAAKQYALQEEARNFERQTNGWRRNDKGEWYYDSNLDLITKAKVDSARAVAEAKNSGKTSSNGTGRSGAGANKLTQSADRLRIKWNGNNPDDLNGDADDDYEIETIEKTETSHSGKLVNYEQLPAYAQKIADEIIGDGDADLYQFYFKPYKSGVFDDTESELEIVPRDIKDFKQSEALDGSIFNIH